MKAAARASQKQELQTNTGTSNQREAALRKANNYSVQSIQAWLAEIKSRKSNNNTPMYRAAQIAAVERVTTRMCAELQQDASQVQVGEPLIECVHGGPGTGKTEVLKLLKELFGICGWQMGLEYQMVALQAVTAHRIGRDTLHHSIGISWSGLPGAETEQQSKVAARVLLWRWLIIDEISMVSSKLLAQIDAKLRDIVRRCHTMKSGSQGIDRAFGGLNVLLVGDFWQLDPPAGGFLGSIPVEYLLRARQFAAKPDVAQGQAILWGRGPDSVQHVTELTECIRTEDAWLLQVQEEFREGRLSEDT